MSREGVSASAGHLIVNMRDALCDPRIENLPLTFGQDLLFNNGQCSEICVLKNLSSVLDRHSFIRSTALMKEFLSLTPSEPLIGSTIHHSKDN